MTSTARAQRTSSLSKPTRVGIYVRISQDRIGAGLGVERQEKLCREYVQTRTGWLVVELYIDNDISASDRRKVRREYQRMLNDVRSGKLDAIVVWHVDRLTRQPRELEDIIDLADEYGTQLGTVTGEVDLATPTGRMVARIMGAAARHEAEHKGERQRAERAESALRGTPHFGGVRPFGYSADRITAVDDEAELIRDAARRALAGETLSSIAREWNDKGIETVKGARWSATALRQILTSARISGRREIGRKTGKVGEIVADDCWEPIITPEQSDKLRRMYTSDEKSRPAGATASKYLLSGIVSCGRCGTAMVSGQSCGRLLYRCVSTTTNTKSKATPCSRVSIGMGGTDAHVEELVAKFLSQPRSTLLKRLAARTDETLSKAQTSKLLKAITADEEQLVELMSDRTDGLITRAEWAVAREKIDARLRQNKSTLERATQTNALTLLDGADDLNARWAQLNLAQKRALLRDIFDTIVVEPSKTRGGRTFDTDRLQPQWKL